MASIGGNPKGFTIVELLIVIVVIGILAAIVIVAYNGITSRANDTSYKTDAAGIAKVIETFNADSGRYPLAADVTSGVFVAPSGIALAAKLPQNVYVVPNTNSSTDTALASASCTTADSTSPFWATCVSGSVKSYAVKMSTTGACVYYLQTAGTATVKSVTAGSPGTC